MFEEQQFGSVYESDQDHWCQLSQRVASHLSIEVVSLALLDGDYAALYVIMKCPNLY